MDLGLALQISCILIGWMGYIILTYKENESKLGYLFALCFIIIGLLLNLAI